MSETIRKTAETTTETSPGIAQEPTNPNMEHPWRKKGLAILGTVAAAAGIGAASYGLGQRNNAETPTPQETATEDIVDNEPTAEATTDTGPSTPEALTLENFPFVIDGEEYVGVNEFTEAMTIQATPATEYPGSPMSEERNEALQTEVNAAVDQWFGLTNDLLNYEFTDEQRAQYENFEYNSPSGELYLGVDAVRAQLVGEAFRDVMTAESAYGDPYPQELLDELIHLSVVADWDNQRRIEDGLSPLELAIQPVDGTEQIGGTELIDDAFVAFGTIQVEVVTNQEQGDGTPVDFAGSYGVDCVRSTEPVTWQLALENMEQDDGTAAWKVTRGIVYDTNNNVICGNLPQ